MEPVFVGMPATERTFEVAPWGEIRCGGVCKDDYQRIVHYAQTGSRTITLQKAAMDSFRGAQDKIRSPLNRYILLTGSNRTCEAQTAFFRQDSSRYAPPNATAHTRGLAIDVDMNQGPFRRRRIQKALLARGWHQARSDEPWHYSFGIQV